MKKESLSRTEVAGAVNVVLVLAWVAATIWLLWPDSAGGPDYSRFFAVLIGWAPIACFYAYRISTLRLVISLLVAAGLGYLIEFLANAAGVWKYPPFDGIGVPGLHVAFIFGFSGIAAFSIAESLDHLLRLRRSLRGTNLYLNSAIIFVAFAALVRLLASEDGGVPGRAAAGSPGVIAFYMTIVLLAWYFASIARTGRLLSLLIGGALICLAGNQLGAEAGLWRFSEGTKCPHFLFAAWPLEVFVWYGLGAFGSAYIASWLRRDGQDPLILARGSIDKATESTVQQASYLMVIALCLAMAGMVYNGALDRPEQWKFAFVLALLFTIAVATSQKAYWVRIVWLFGLGMALGYALSLCQLLTWQTAIVRPPPTAPVFGRHLFMLPVWGMAAVATYGIGASLARWLWEGSEWTSLDRPGPTPVLVVAVVLLIALGFGISTGQVQGASSGSTLIAIVLVTAVTVLAAALAGLATAIPVLLLGIGFLFSGGEMVHLSAGSKLAVPQLLAVLLFVSAAAHLCYKSIVEIRTRTLFGFAVAAIVLCVIILGGAWAFGLISHAGRPPWYLAIGLAPLLLMAACTASGTWSGSAQNRIPPEHSKPMKEPTYTPPPQAPAPAKSLVALAVAREEDGKTRAERSSACLGRALQMLDQGGEAGVDTISRYFRESESVFIKPNVVLPLYSPCTVLPELIYDLAARCVEGGASRVVIGETSLSEFTARQTLVSTGFKEYWESADDEGRVEVELLDETQWLPIDTGAAEDPEPFGYLPRSLVECKRYINVSKLKTHYITGVTLSIKNSLGLVLDEEKWIEHCGCYNVHRLARKLVRIMRARRPDLVLIDGFDGLEGDGPFIGARVDTQFIIASTDPVAADCVAAALMGRDPATIATCTIASELGLGNSDWSRIEVVREDGPLTPLPAALAPLVHDFAPPEKEPEGEVAQIGPLTLISQDPPELRAGPWSTLYGVLSLIRPLAEIYMPREWSKLRGMTIVYGEVKRPVEAEAALLFGDRAIASQHLVYAPMVWEVPGAIPNSYLAAMNQIAIGGDLDVLKIISTALRRTKGDYL